MKISVLAKELKSALTAVKNVPAKGMPPVVQFYVLVAPSLEGAELTATDYETRITAYLPSAIMEVETPGALLPLDWAAKTLAALRPGVRDVVTVEWSGETVTITAKGVSITSPAITETVEDFPVSEAAITDEWSRAVIDGEELSDTLQAAQRHASNDETLPIIAAARLEHTADGLEVLATDRYRLIHDVVPSQHLNGDSEWSANIPLTKRSLPWVKALTGPTHIFVQPGERGCLPNVILQADNLRVALQTRDGDYPRIRSLFPAYANSKAVVMRAEVLEAAKTASKLLQPYLISSMKRQTPPVRISDDGQALTLTALQGEAWESTGSGLRVSAETDQLEDVLISGAHLVDSLASCKRDAVTFGQTSPHKPLLIESGSRRMLVMPMRLPR